MTNRDPVHSQEMAQWQVKHLKICFAKKIAFYDLLFFLATHC
jgi:hypothetical protein